LDRNTLLAIALSLLVLSAWTSYEAANAPPLRPASEMAEVSRGDAGGTRVVGDAWPTDDQGAAPGRNIRQIAKQDERPDVLVPSPAEEAAPWTGGLESDLFRVELDNRGGGISSWRLLDPLYTADSKGGATEPLELVTRIDDTSLALTNSLKGLGIGDLKKALWDVESSEGERVVFSIARGGIEVRKTYTFDPESYVFGYEVEIRNETDTTLETDLDVEWPAAMVDGNDFREQSLSTLVNDEVETEMVPSVGSGGFFSFLGNGDDGPSTYVGLVNWAGVSNRYFFAGLIPNEASTSVARVTFLPVIQGKVAVSRFAYEGVEIKPGEIVSRNFRAYMGPKIPERLAAISPGLERAVDFGYSWLEPLTRFFHWFLALLYGFIPNYGVAIIILTVMVRVVTLPIMQKQMKSMERMRELQPRLKEIQEQHKENRQRQSEEQMKLYKEEGVNPLGGCLPMLLQFPVFIGLFYALQSTIALRHAPFMLWITDLSAPEELFVIPGLDLPVRVLPVVMGASMLIQQRMTPMTGMDPVQARMMTTVMPLMMTVLFYQFPSGLVLYWMISNFLGIGHQLWVRKSREKES
jgi:YidC/Oxa1 family membrane protein insertase